MVTVYVRFNLKDGSTSEEEKTLSNKITALRFMYNMRRKKHTILGWKCTDPDENEYLSKRFHLSTQFVLKRK